MKINLTAISLWSESEALSTRTRLFLKTPARVKIFKNGCNVIV